MKRLLFCIGVVLCLGSLLWLEMPKRRGSPKQIEPKTPIAAIHVTLKDSDTLIFLHPCSEQRISVKAKYFLGFQKLFSGRSRPKTVDPGPVIAVVEIQSEDGDITEFEVFFNDTLEFRASGHLYQRSGLYVACTDEERPRYRDEGSLFCAFCNALCNNRDVDADETMNELLRSSGHLK